MVRQLVGQSDLVRARPPVQPWQVVQQLPLELLRRVQVRLLLLLALEDLAQVQPILRTIFQEQYVTFVKKEFK